MAEFNDGKKESLLKWFKIKIELELFRKSRKIFFSEGEIWWASIGSNIGHEEDGKNEKFERPVLILKKFNNFLIFVVPLSSKLKEGDKYYYKLFCNYGFSSVLLSQARAISTKRLSRKKGAVDNHNLSKIRALIRDML